MKQVIRIAGGSVAGLLLGLVCAGFAGLVEYRSVAVLRIVPPVVAALPTVELPVRDWLPYAEAEVLSRSQLAAIIQTKDLYKSERSRMPMERVVDRMRQRLRLRPMPPFSFSVEPGRDDKRSNRPVGLEVSFRYRDARMAQQVTQEIARQICALRYDFVERSGVPRPSMAKRETPTSLSDQPTPAPAARLVFLKTVADHAAAALDAAERAPAGNGQRKAADVAIARAHFDSAQEQFERAEEYKELGRRQAVETIEVLDAASLPSDPEFPNAWMPGAGFAAGALTMAIVAGLRRLA